MKDAVSPGVTAGGHKNAQRPGFPDVVRLRFINPLQDTVIVPSISDQVLYGNRRGHPNGMVFRHALKAFLILKIPMLHRIHASLHSVDHRLCAVGVSHHGIPRIVSHGDHPEHLFPGQRLSGHASVRGKIHDPCGHDLDEIPSISSKFPQQFPVFFPAAVSAADDFSITSLPVDRKPRRPVGDPVFRRQLSCQQSGAVGIASISHKVHLFSLIRFQMFPDQSLIRTVPVGFSRLFIIFPIHKNMCMTLCRHCSFFLLFLRLFQQEHSFRRTPH